MQIRLDQLPSADSSELFHSDEKRRRGSREAADLSAAQELTGHTGDTLASWTRTLTDSLQEVGRKQALDEIHDDVAGSGNAEETISQSDASRGTLIKATIDKRAHLLLFNSVASRYCVLIPPKK
jgi:hypothetical protein